MNKSSELSSLIKEINLNQLTYVQYHNLNAVLDRFLRSDQVFCELKKILKEDVVLLLIVCVFKVMTSTLLIIFIVKLLFDVIRVVISNRVNHVHFENAMNDIKSLKHANEYK